MQAPSEADEAAMPFLVEAQADEARRPDALASRVIEQRRDLDERLLQTGALLFRGYGVVTAQAFHHVVASLRPRLLGYVGGDSPRTALGDGIYTSTEFPAHMEIGLHNEMSYTHSWPESVFFCCLIAPQSGGETHIADSRKVFSQMDPEVRERFSKRGVLYRQHLRDDNEEGPGKSWQETFETTDRDEVERVCSDQGLAFCWTTRGLRTSLSNPGVLKHPRSGEICWFNQADLWHRSFDTVKVQECRTPRDDHGDESIGSHACYADGSEIPTTDLVAVRSTYGKIETRFRWQAGDVLMLDNVLAMHGRKPFDGERRVLVAMA
jgi:alpha-ketoglutarate-dependent taurine dioxygenase